MITPLPCDVRHYFHTNCIEDWYSQKGRDYCPLCKETFTLAQIEEYNERFTELACDGKDSQVSEGDHLLEPAPEV